MGDPLRTYLRDHLTGSHFALNLLESLSERYPNSELGTFAQQISIEIKQDQEILESIIDQVGTARFDMTEATGWLVEKASQLKLRRDDDSKPGLGTFEALETLALGIQGKQALWRVLPVIRHTDTRLPDLDFEKLIERAKDQHRLVERTRLSVAQTAFSPEHQPAPDK
jgi:hypothetical protein